MTRFRLDNRTGGLSLVVGYCFLVVLLFRNPSDGVAIATETIQGFLFFILFPVCGIASGVVLLFDWPFRTAVAVLASSYLGVVGIALALLPSTNAGVTTVLGLLFFALANLALVAALRSSVETLVPDGVLE
jgi:hypothetical protein